MNHAPWPQPMPGTWRARWRLRGRHRRWERCRSGPCLSAPIVRYWRHAATPRSPPMMRRLMRKSAYFERPDVCWATTGFRARRCTSLWNPARCARAHSCMPGSHALSSGRRTHAPVHAAVSSICRGITAGTTGSKWWAASWPRKARRCCAVFSRRGDLQSSPPQIGWSLPGRIRLGTSACAASNSVAGCEPLALP